MLITESKAIWVSLLCPWCGNIKSIELPSSSDRVYLHRCSCGRSALVFRDACFGDIHVKNGRILTEEERLRILNKSVGQVKVGQC